MAMKLILLVDYKNEKTWLPTQNKKRRYNICKGFFVEKFWAEQRLTYLRNGPSSSSTIASLCNHKRGYRE